MSGVTPADEAEMTDIVAIPNCEVHIADMRERCEFCHNLFHWYDQFVPRYNEPSGAKIEAIARAWCLVQTKLPGGQASA